MQRYAWGIFDLLLWPFSIVWAAPSNYHLARTRKNEIQGTVALQELKPERTRMRITLKGMDWDTNKYPAVIRSLQEEIERQLFVKAGTDRDLDDEPAMQTMEKNPGTIGPAEAQVPGVGAGPLQGPAEQAQGAAPPVPGDRARKLAIEAQALRMLGDCLKRSEADPLIDCSKYEDAFKTAVGH